MKEQNYRREFLKVPSLMSVFEDGFCYIKFLERRRALEKNKEEINRRAKEVEEMKLGGQRKKKDIGEDSFT